MEKRFLLAFTLSLAVFIGYHYFVYKIYGPFSPTPTEDSQVLLKNEVTERPLPPSPPTSLTPGTEGPTPEEVVSSWEPVLLESEKLILALHPKEGSIRTIFVKGYLNLANEPLKLVEVEGEKLLIGIGWIESPKFTQILYDKVVQEPKKVIFQALLSEGISIQKEIAFSESPYILSLSITFQNRSNQTFPLSYSLVAASGLEPQAGDERFFEAVIFAQGKRKSFRLGKVLKHPVSSKEKPQWAALKEKYFSLILKPETDLSGFAIQPTGNRKSMAIRTWSAPKDLPPGGEVKENYLLYFGPNQLKELSKLGAWAEGVLDYGLFGGATKLILWALTHLYLAVKNYGLAIVLLTILVSILFLPLSGVSYNSMKKMKLLQPEIHKLRAQYKGKPQKMNKELMALYKKHRVNPLGGCLPMLIQMPIFIAFYQALIHSIELKGASFLFIKDLSLPDQAIPLPVTLGPLGNAINVLPILMMFAMYFQQKMMSPGGTPGPEAETQRMMMTFMPFIFGVIFYRLPSGLVLYWLTNNVVMIVSHKLFFAHREPQSAP